MKALVVFTIRANLLLVVAIAQGSFVHSESLSPHQNIQFDRASTRADLKRMTSGNATRVSVLDQTVTPKLQSSCTLLPVFNADAADESKKMGFIDLHGDLKIGFKYYHVEGFREGLATITLERDGPEGYIDEEGNIVIAPQFDWAFPFFEGRAKVLLGHKWGYIDRHGRVVIGLNFDEGGNFHEGLAAVKTAGRWGYIDADGRVAIPRTLDKANDFSEGLASVVKDGLIGYIDRSGKWVIEPRFEMLPSPTDALSLPNFSEGLSVVRIGRRYGYVDETGEMAIRPQFEQAGAFSEGLASVRVNNKAGFINQAGQIMLNPQFNAARKFSDGLAAVMVGKKWGYIDKAGEMVITPQFESAEQFCNGLARVWFGSEFGYIVPSGKFIWKGWKDSSASLFRAAKVSCDFSSFRSVRIVQLDPKTIVKRVEPDYPSEAFDRGIEGRVRVKALLNGQGEIQQACAIEGNAFLRSAAEKAALQWRFKPRYALAVVHPTTQTNSRDYAELYLAFEFQLHSSTAKKTLAQRRTR